MKLDCSKSTGPDGISARMLRETTLSITQPLTSLFNMLIQRRSFPSLWKFANVVPIPKNSTCKSSPSTYRPLPVISKLFEKHIYSVLLDHFQHHCPISQHQWGFQAGKSTTTALAATIHDWHNHLDVGRDVAMVFFDFKKAFDTVPHRRLLEKLSQVHLHNYVVDLIESYLTARSQCVVVNGASSQPVHVLSGVPQGSVLGPLLFIFYVNTLSNLKLSGGSKLVMYADDLVLHKAIITEEEWISFQNDINSIVQ